MGFNVFAWSVAAALVITAPLKLAGALQAKRSLAPLDTRISVGSASLYARVIGQGRPIIVLHGGPDFDHSYLLPDLDQFQDTFSASSTTIIGAEGALRTTFVRRT